MSIYLNADNDLDRVLQGDLPDFLVQKFDKANDTKAWYAGDNPGPAPLGPITAVLYANTCMSCGWIADDFAYMYRNNGAAKDIITQADLSQGVLTATHYELLPGRVPVCGRCVVKTLQRLP